MKLFGRLALVATAVSLAACQADRTNADTAAIRALQNAYAKAVDTADMADVEKVWSAWPEVSFIHPLGNAKTLAGVEGFYRDVMGGLFTDRHLSIADSVIHVSGDSAWAEFHWDFSAKNKKDSSPFESHGRETQIYRREQDGWRLVHVHYSGMPTSGPGDGAQAATGKLTDK